MPRGEELSRFCSEFRVSPQWTLPVAILFDKSNLLRLLLARENVDTDDLYDLMRIPLYHANNLGSPKLVQLLRSTGRVMVKGVAEQVISDYPSLC